MLHTYHSHPTPIYLLSTPSFYSHATYLKPGSLAPCSRLSTYLVGQHLSYLAALVHLRNISIFGSTPRQTDISHLVSLHLPTTYNFLLPDT